MGFIGRWAWLNKFENRETGDFGGDWEVSGHGGWPEGFNKMGHV